MDVYQGTGAVATGDDGGFTAWWVVPQVLSEGTYTVNATDDEGLFAQSSFSVGPSVVSISSRKATYARGDTVGFDLESSFREEDSYITILDPDGSFAWQTDDLDTWIRVGVTYVAPLYTQTAGGNPMTLESDAPLGTWTYTWYDSDDEELASGSFMVGEETTDDDEEPGDGVITDAQYEELLAEVEGLKEDLAQLREDVDQLLVTVDQLSGTTSTSIGEVLAEVRNVKEDVEDALDSAEEARGVATDARDEIDTVKDDAEQALSTASGHTTMIYAALGASLVAILLTFVGPMQISRKPQV